MAPAERCVHAEWIQSGIKRPLTETLHSVPGSFKNYTVQYSRVRAGIAVMNPGIHPAALFTTADCPGYPGMTAFPAANASTPARPTGMDAHALRYSLSTPRRR